MLVIVKIDFKLKLEFYSVSQLNNGYFPVANRACTTSVEFEFKIEDYKVEFEVVVSW